MIKNLIGLLAVVYVVLGVSFPAFAQETTYVRWGPNGEMIAMDRLPDYQEVTVLYDILVAERPSDAAPIGRRPSTREERVRFGEQINRWDTEIARSALTHKVPAELIKAVMLRESGGNPNAVSPTGATGLMQFISSTAKKMGVLDRRNPVQSIMGGGKYIRLLLDSYEGRPNQLELAISAYNAGPEAVKDAGYRIPPKRETQVFVPRVLQAYKLLLTEHPVPGAEALRPSPGHPLYPRS
jgi:soluble lytic murein transglycosylase-like protein